MAKIDRFQFCVCIISFIAGVVLTTYYTTGTIQTFDAQYTSLNAPYCDDIPPVIMANHHKMGHRISTYLHIAFQRTYCHGKTRVSFRMNKASCSRVDALIQKTRHKTHINMVFHMIRRPLDTILSAYNYHKRDPEPWCHHTWNGLNDVNLPWHNNLSLIVRDINKILKLKLTQKVNPKKDSLVDILNRESLKVGLYFEYAIVKYWFFDNEYYPVYSDQCGFAINNNISVYNIRLESFMESTNSFQNAVLDVLDKMKIVDKKRRNSILGIMMEHDVHSKDITDRKKQLSHQTQGTYNKTLQIDTLLSISNNVCLNIKNWTILLDYQWKYDRYC